MVSASVSNRGTDRRCCRPARGTSRTSGCEASWHQTNPIDPISGVSPRTCYRAAPLPSRRAGVRVGGPWVVAARQSRSKARCDEYYFSRYGPLVMLRTRLFALVSAAVAVTIILVTWAVSASARRAFAAVDAERTAALVAQFRREFTSEAEQIAARVERLASSDAVLRTASDIARSRADRAAYVDEASSLAASQGWDVLDLVAEDGTIE